MFHKAPQQTTGLYQELVAQLKALYLDLEYWRQAGGSSEFIDRITGKPNVRALTEGFVNELNLTTPEYLAVFTQSGKPINWKKVNPSCYREVAAEVLAMGLAEVLDLHQAGHIKVEGVSIPVASTFISRYCHPQKGGPDQIAICNPPT